MSPVCASCYVHVLTLLTCPTVMLQLMKDGTPLSSKCKDKFLIQSALITPEKETRDLQEFVGLSSCIAYSHHHVRPQWNAQAGTGEEIVPSSTYVKDAIQAAPLVQPQRSATPPAPERDVNSSQEAGSYWEELEFQRSTSGGVGIVNVNMHLPSPPLSPLVAWVASINQELEMKYIAAHDEIQQLWDLLVAVADPSSLAPESIVLTSITPSDFRRRHTLVLSDDGEMYAGSDVGTMVEHDSVIYLTCCLLSVIILCIAIHNLI
ncbi:hypothetical protein DFH29DRAFT_818846 [Suillus ampliporus]|nr:hypothetical protein DFH29DRAFT_818846 [Suillus ampliporus]